MCTEFLFKFSIFRSLSLQQQKVFRFWHARNRNRNTFSFDVIDFCYRSAHSRIERDAERKISQNRKTISYANEHQRQWPSFWDVPPKFSLSTKQFRNVFCYFGCGGTFYSFDLAQTLSKPIKTLPKKTDRFELRTFVCMCLGLIFELSTFNHMTPSHIWAVDVLVLVYYRHKTEKSRSTVT